MAYRDHLITSMEQLQALYGAAGFVRILDDKTLAIPDRPGNNRIDSFRNIMRDPRMRFCFSFRASARRCA